MQDPIATIRDLLISGWNALADMPADLDDIGWDTAEIFCHPGLYNEEAKEKIQVTIYGPVTGLTSQCRWDRCVIKEKRNE